MDHIILIRMNNGGVVSLSSEDDYIVTYPDRDAAIAAAQKHPLTKRMPYQIVELDEL